jgi:hypothetical protein
MVASAVVGETLSVSGVVVSGFVCNREFLFLPDGLHLLGEIVSEKVLSDGISVGTQFFTLFREYRFDHLPSTIR